MSNGAAVATAAPTVEQTVEVSRSILDDLIKATTEKERQQYVIIPKTFEEAEKYADFVAKSQLLPKGMGKNEVFLVIQVGLEFGLSPMQALKGMFCVNNRVSIYGDLAVALVLRSGKMELFDEDNAEIALKQGFGRCRVKRHGSPACRVDPARPQIKCVDAFEQKPRACCLEHRFTVDQAKTAKLWTKEGPWTSYPGRMLQMRPRSWALRDVFADVLMGLDVYEEARDIPATPHTNAVIEETMRLPRRLGETAKPAEPAKASEPAPAAASSPAPAPAPAQSAPVDATEGTGEFNITKVERIEYDEKKEGKPTGKKKHFYKLHTPDEKTTFATFSDTEADAASSCVGKAPVKIEWKRTPGKENLAIKKLAPVIAGPTDSEIPEEPGSNG
jgi:hypothetical protein